MKAGLLAGRQASGGGSASLLQNVIHHWDYSTTPTSPIDDLVGSADQSNSSLSGSTSAIGSNGLDCLVTTGTSSSRISLTSGGGGIDNINPDSSPFGVTIVLHANGGNCCMIDTKNTSSARPHCFQTGATHYLAQDIALNATALSTGDHVVYYEFDGTTSKVYIDGSLNVSGSPGSTATTGTALTFMNTANSANTATAGWAWGEALITTGTQTAGDISDEYDRLAAKWGF